MYVCGFPGNSCQLRAEVSTNHLYFKRQNYVIFRMPSHAQCPTFTLIIIIIIIINIKDWTL